MSTPKPFTLQVPDAAVADLRERLARTRWPEQPPGAPWATGTELGWLQQLVAHWRDQFDWRVQEARLNAFPQYRVPLAGIELHYFHVPGQGPNPMPLLLSHGWPGSVVEFLDLIPRLTDPARFGGDPADAFTVVAPSLPGFTLSFAPGQPRFSGEAITDCYAELMTLLGYPRFAAQGGDWGSFVVSRLAGVLPDRVIGIHLNLLPLRRSELPAAKTPDEQTYYRELAHWLREETGYQAIQGTRPQTLAYALTDSPAGLAAWIGEKFHAWTDCGPAGDPLDAVDRDALLANISLYWFTGAIGSSFWPYYARMHGPWPVPDRIDVPMGYTEFPREILHPPRTLAETVYRDIRRWTPMPRGGHFAAMEQPEALAAEIQAFFRPLRTQR